MKKLCIIVGIIVAVIVLSVMLLAVSDYRIYGFDPGPPEVFRLSNVDDLYKLSAAFETKDAEVIHNCMETMGMYPQEEEKVRAFLTAFESIPVVELLDGTVTSLYCQWSAVVSKDLFGKYYDDESNWFAITTKAEDGSWVSVDYCLGGDEVIERSLRSAKRFKFFSKPFTTENGRIIVYSEKRQAHPTQDGDMIKWVVTIDGVCAEITYFSQNIDSIKTEEVFNNARISIGKFE